MIEIIPVKSEAQVGAIRSLFREYAGSLETDLCFQSFEQELAELPENYLGLYLALEEERPAGCVGLRNLSERVCELKRLYVRPAYRSQGLGRRLVLAASAEARRLGYERMRLDTLPSMKRALALYRSMGFTAIRPYYLNPVPGATFWELSLR